MLRKLKRVKKVIKKREKLLNNAAPKEQPPRKLSGKRTVHNNSGKKAWASPKE
jgi:hypothetical protein